MGEGENGNRKLNTSEMHPRITISSMLPKILKNTHTQNKRAQEEDIPSAMKSLKSSTATTSHTWKSTICDVSPSVTLPWTFTSLSREPENSPKVMGKSDSPSQHC